MLIKLEWCHSLDPSQCALMELSRYGEKNYDNMLSLFHLIQERHGQRERDKQNCYINIARHCADVR